MDDSQSSITSEQIIETNAAFERLATFAQCLLITFLAAAGVSALDKSTQIKPELGHLKLSTFAFGSMLVIIAHSLYEKISVWSIYGVLPHDNFYNQRTEMFKLGAFLKTVLISAPLSFICIYLAVVFHDEFTVSWSLVIMGTSAIVLLLRYIVYNHRVSLLQALASFMSITCAILLVYFQYDMLQMPLSVKDG